jgi:tRNA pseudouridine32 synthase/23S rRNA pseudouridine746 synthase
VPPAEVFTHTRTYPSLTTFASVWEEQDHTLLAVQPVTGRRHQIRVHLAWIGHPIEGDPLFDSRPGPGAQRTGLHSWRLAFDAPWSDGSRIQVEAPPGDDFWACLDPNRASLASPTILEAARALEPVVSGRLAGPPDPASPRGS